MTNANFKKVLYFVVFGTMLFGLYVFLSSDDIDVGPDRTFLAANIPQTILKFQESRVTPREDGIVEVEAYINAGENEVTDITLQFSYDPKILDFELIKQTDFLYNKPELVKEIDEKNGLITYRAQINEEDVPIRGEDAILEIEFKLLSTTEKSTKVKILPTSNVIALNIPSSALIGVEDVIIDLEGNE